MKNTWMIALAIVFVMALLRAPQVVWAHQSVQIGDYAVEYGWVNEPAIVNQPNAVVVNITGPGGDTKIDASGLQVQAILGSEKKTLVLQPLGEDTPGQFIAPITPTRPGVYTIHFSGAIGSTTFNNDVQPEEVNTSDLVQFPVASATGDTATTGLGLPAWVGIIGLLLGAAGTVLGVLAMTRKPTGPAL